MKCLLVDAKLSLKKNRQIDHHITTVIAANDALEMVHTHKIIYLNLKDLILTTLKKYLELRNTSTLIRQFKEDQ